ncbi:MAG: glycosyltransferase family 39 protein [bacterium]|nr:glycosyltransferase family 39 protein [bacterium]
MFRTLWLIFFLALFTRTLFFFVALTESGSFTTAFPAFDGYYQLTENLLHGNGFSRDLAPPFVPDSIRTILYPLLMAGLVYVFKSYGAVLIAQIILGSLIPLLGYKIARELIPQRWVALAVAVVLAIEPFSVELTTTIRNETLFTVLFLGSMAFFLDYWKNKRASVLAGSSLLLALATLARPTTQYLPLLIIVTICYLLWRERARALRHSALFLVIFFAVLSPWMLRNFILFHNPALSAQYASVPFGYLLPSAIAFEKHQGFEEAKREFYAGEGQLANFEDINLTNAPYYKQRAVELLKLHPVGALKSSGVTLLTFFTHDGYLDILYRVGAEPTLRLERPAFSLFFSSPLETLARLRPLLLSPLLFVILGRLLWIGIALCFIIGTLRYLKAPQERAKGIFVLLIIAYFVLTTVAVGLSVNARFRFPVNAFILVFAVYGIHGLTEKYGTRRNANFSTASKESELAPVTNVEEIPQP